MLMLTRERERGEGQVGGERTLGTMWAPSIKRVYFRLKGATSRNLSALFIVFNPWERIKEIKEKIKNN